MQQCKDVHIQNAYVDMQIQKCKETKLQKMLGNTLTKWPMASFQICLSVSPIWDEPFYVTTTTMVCEQPFLLGKSVGLLLRHKH